MQPDELIPTVDVSDTIAGAPGAVDALAPVLADALERVGFYCLTGHGIDASLIDAVFAATRDFHALPLAEKMALRANEHNVGYMPVNGYVSRSSRISTSRKPNLVEALFVKRDLAADHPDVVSNKRFRCQNQWPDSLPGFRATVVRYIEALDRLGRRLLPVYARALELPQNYFAEAFADPQVTLRMSHYPPPETGDDDQFGVAPHTDSSFLTILAHSGLPGLEIRLPDGKWHAAPVVDDAFIVNSGDMLRRWTNHRFLSTPHRVVNCNPGRDRYAIPFFFDANIDHPMVCLPGCHDADNPPRYEPVSVLDYMIWFSNQYDHVRERDGVTVQSPGVPE